MENPQKELRNIIRNLVQNDDLELQKRTILQYFSPDAVLDHPLTRQEGLSEVICGYQALALANYDIRPTLDHVLYNENDEYLFVNWTLHLRPWWNPLFRTEVPVLSYLQLEDVPEDQKSSEERRRPPKWIKFQQDHLGRSALLIYLPVGRIIATSQLFRNLVTKVLLVEDVVLQTLGVTTLFNKVTQAAHKFLGF